MENDVEAVNRGSHDAAAVSRDEARIPQTEESGETADRRDGHDPVIVRAEVAVTTD